MQDLLLPNLNLIVPLLVLSGALLPESRRLANAAWINLMGFILTIGLIGAQWFLPEALMAWWGPLPGYALAIATLVTFLGTVLARFSVNYLNGEKGLADYARHLQLTLGSVLLVALTDHLGVLVVGWVAISLGLHRLLTFYPDRHVAQVAARKKFILARTAEVTLLTACGLIFLEYGSWSISDIAAQASAAAPGLYGSIAAVLLAVVALIKCAQLPVHGWLIDVVEAPTPVSALLHAGVINLGGLLLLMFAPLIAQVVAAQWLLLVVAGLTTVIATLVMSVEISVKVRLAWSTSAQMGLMLVECALGLYQLALLHLIAHACYKAYVFLSAGSAVDAKLRQAMLPPAKTSRFTGLIGYGAAIALVAAVVWLAQQPTALSPWLLLTGTLTMVLIETASRGGRYGFAAAGSLAIVVLASYLVQKSVIQELVTPAAAPVGGDLWISILLVTLAVVSKLLASRPYSPGIAQLRRLLFAGLYLDSWFTRSIQGLLPAARPATPRQTDSTLSGSAEEAS